MNIGFMNIVSQYFLAQTEEGARKPNNKEGTI